MEPEQESQSSSSPPQVLVKRSKDVHVEYDVDPEADHYNEEEEAYEFAQTTGKLTRAEKRFKSLGDLILARRTDRQTIYDEVFMLLEKFLDDQDAKKETIADLREKLKHARGDASRQSKLAEQKTQYRERFPEPGQALGSDAKVNCCFRWCCCCCRGNDRISQCLRIIWLIISVLILIPIVVGVGKTMFYFSSYSNSTPPATGL